MKATYHWLKTSFPFTIKKDIGIKMKPLFTLLLIICCCSHSFRAQTPADLPFTISLEEVTHPDWTGLHSFAFAKWDGYWIIVAGRSNGLHGFFPFTGFPEQTANQHIWLMDPETGDFWQSDLFALPDSVAAGLQSSNPQYVQKEDKLYVFGGYGKAGGSDDFITFDQLTVLDLPTLVDALQMNKSILPAIHAIEDDRLKVCGGEAHQLGEWTYLVGGHDFNGLYSQGNAPAFTQAYTNEIRRFKLGVDAVGWPTLTEYESFADPEFHRRDLSVAPCILPNGEEGLCAYGGVFKPDADLPYLHPIYISEQDIEVNTDYEQLMSQYTCPVLPVYDAMKDEMHSVFFGGLSYHTYDRVSQKFELAELIPFIRSFTLMSRAADGSTQERVLDAQFDELLGTNAKLVLAKNVSLYAEGIIDLNSIETPQMVGYIFGGIKAVIPNITPSSASQRLFKIWLTPSTITANEEPSTQEALARVFPNPFRGAAQVDLVKSTVWTEVVLTNTLGRTLLRVRGNQTEEIADQLALKLDQLSPGHYQLWLRTPDQSQRLSLLKF